MPRQRFSLFCLLAPLLLAAALASSAGAQAPPNRAGLIVQYGDGQVETACVAFEEPEISGAELLRRSGLPLVTQASPLGEAVCKIGPDGCDYPAEGCFCERDGPRAIYWAFQIREGDAWRYSVASASAVMAADGDIHGWAWGLGESGAGATPPLLDLEAVCGPVGAAVAPPATASGSTPQAAPPAPSAPAPAAAPTAAPAAPAAAEEPLAAPGGPDYLWFGLIALLLLAGLGLAARRR